MGGGEVDSIIMKWYIKVIQNYVNFKGRARRTEYWMFALFNSIFMLSAVMFDNLLDIVFYDAVYGPIYFIYSLLVLLPSLAVAVRRLHDIGKSGWYLLLSLIPIVGQIWLIVLLAQDGEPSLNLYGPNPKA